nr:immunoglobulin light chain junction region [Macaca mulatta]
DYYCQSSGSSDKHWVF